MNEFIVSIGSGDKVISSDNGSRGRASHKGSRKGYTSVDGKSPIEYLKMLYDLQGFPDQRKIIYSGDEDAAEEYLKENLELDNSTYEAELKDLVEEWEEGQREGSRKGGYYNDALQAHAVYHGYEDWEDEAFVPEDEALETLEGIAEDEGTTVDALVAEMHRFRKENNK